LKHQRELFDSVGASLLNIRNSSTALEGWYQVKPQELKKVKCVGYLIASRYEGSVSKALATVYEGSLFPWRFEHCPSPRGYWRDPLHRRAFFDWFLRSVLQASSDLSAFYNVRVQQVREAGGAGLLGKYRNSLMDALRATYPTHPWDAARFHRVPKGTISSDITAQRELLCRLGQQLRPATTSSSSPPSEGMPLEEWYKVAPSEVAKLDRGQELLKHYKGSLVAALAAAYPDHSWQPWRFKHAPRGLWSSPAHHRQFLEWASRELGFHGSMDAWYTTTIDQIEKLGGYSLLTGHYGGSLVKALITNFPEHKWQLWRFSKIPNDFWDDPVALREWLHEVATRLRLPLPQSDGRSSIKVTSDDATKATDERLVDEWHRISPKQLKQVGMKPAPPRVGGLLGILKRVYPSHPWRAEQFSLTSKRATQRHLLLLVKELVGPSCEILEEYHVTASSMSSTTSDVATRRNESLRLDLYLPSLAIGFEYQGQQHTQDVHIATQAALQGSRDVEKAAMCARAGITLISVPVEWDRSRDALLRIIQLQNPDALRRLAHST
jgi:hypothetical protein